MFGIFTDYLMDNKSLLNSRDIKYILRNNGDFYKFIGCIGQHKINFNDVKSCIAILQNIKDLDQFFYQIGNSDFKGEKLEKNVIINGLENAILSDTIAMDRFIDLVANEMNSRGIYSIESPILGEYRNKIFLNLLSNDNFISRFKNKVNLETISDSFYEKFDSMDYTYNEDSYNKCISGFAKLGINAKVSNERLRDIILNNKRQYYIDNLYNNGILTQDQINYIYEVIFEGIKNQQLVYYTPCEGMIATNGSRFAEELYEFSKSNDTYRTEQFLNMIYETARLNGYDYKDMFTQDDVNWDKFYTPSDNITYSQFISGIYSRFQYYLKGTQSSYSDSYRGAIKYYYQTNLLYRDLKINECFDINGLNSYGVMSIYLNEDLEYDKLVASEEFEKMPVKYQTFIRAVVEDNCLTRIHIDLSSISKKEFIDKYFDDNGLLLPNVKNFLSDYHFRIAMFDSESLSKLLSEDEKWFLNVLGNDNINFSSDFIENNFDGREPKESFYKFALDKQYYFLLEQFDYKSHVDPVFGFVLEKYFEIDPYLRQSFLNFYNENKDMFTLDNIEFFGDLFVKVSYSNSSEIASKSHDIIKLLLSEPDKERIIEKFDEIENIFVKNNIPTPGKLFKVFTVLNGDENLGNMIKNNAVSPVLHDARDVKHARRIIYNDLIKTAVNSNNKSLREYLISLKDGNEIVQQLITGYKQYEELTNDEKQITTEFYNHLRTLYENSELTDGKFNESEDIVDNLRILVDKIGPTSRYSLVDRIVRMFAYEAGYKNLNSMLEAMDKAMQKSLDSKLSNMSDVYQLQVGDFVKGIGKIDYLENILNNGSVAAEYLGDSSHSDCTPLDTDLSRVDVAGAPDAAISDLACSGYGPIYFVYKNSEKISITRNKMPTDSSEPYKKPFSDQLEFFMTGVLGSDHFGARTGIGTCDIDFIFCDDSVDLNQVKMEIAKHNIYIPVTNKQGKLVFSYEEFLELRSKMAGLTYYDNPEYKFSENLYNPELEELVSQLNNNEEETNNRRNAIYFILNDAILKASAILGVDLTPHVGLSYDLTPGRIDFIDTGSTGRGTNKPNDSDFDFIFRLDREIVSKPDKLSVIKNCLSEALGGDTIGNGDFRLKDVSIPGIELPVDIDITFITRTNKMDFSTDMALKERIANIKKQDPEKAKMIIANIIFAKKIFKANNCYKPDRGDLPQGGLGGVGVENWILQHGGSLYDASVDLVNVYNNCITYTNVEGKQVIDEKATFEKFREKYKVNDLGKNHMAKMEYPYDEFVSRNMSASGLTKVVECCNRYILAYNKNEAYDFDDEKEEEVGRTL